MSEQRKIFSNSASMLVNRLAQAIGTFVLTAAIVRMLGAEALGQYLLAASYYFIFVNIASQGLRTLFTRELSRDLEAAPIYLVNGTVLQLFLSSIAYIVLVALIKLLPYGADTSTLCYIFGLTIIPFSLSNITEAIFQAQERMHLIAISAVPIYILRLFLMIWMMQSQHGVQALAGMMFVSETVILVIQWLLLLKTVKPKWQINQGFIISTMMTIQTFFAIEAAGIVAAKLDVLLLSLLGNELLVGIYSGLTQLIQPYSIIVSSLGLAAFPRMAKAVEQGRAQQQQQTESFIEFLLIIAIPLWIGLFFLGEDLLMFIYHDSNFIGVSTIFRISSFTMVLFPFIRILGYVLITNGFERFNLFEVIITTFIGALSGIVLISNYQLLGSALMDIVVSCSACSLLMWAIYSRLFPLRLWKIFSYPVLIGGCIIPILMILQKTGLSFLGTAMITTFAYFVLVSYLGIHRLGGPRVVLTKLLSKR